MQISGGRQIRWLADAPDVARPVAVYGLAIGILSAVMAFLGWHAVTAAVGVVVVMIAGLMFFQVYHSARRLDRQSREISDSACRAEKHYVEVLWRMVNFVESRDPHNAGHSLRVAELAEQMAREMGLPRRVCQEMRVAGRLHDLGMLAVPERVLSQRCRMGLDDYRTIQKHPQVAQEVLQPLASLRDVIPAILHHHERMNGTGYPAGLTATAIPLGAKILAVADAYDAMTHDRPHQAAVSPMAAVAELKRCAPAGFDPACVEALAKVKNLHHLKEAIGV
jgi:HD-GYP domain-containing protein (c-di-GMP phosphodiesterase class II)